jgi:hypothetical protein
MSINSPTDESLRAAVDMLKECGGNKSHAAIALKLDRGTFRHRLEMAARRGLMLDAAPAMPGFEISKVTTAPDGGQHVTQKQEHGDVFEMPGTHFLGKMTVQRDADGRVVQDWIRAMPDAAVRDAAMRATVDAFKEELPRVEPVLPVPCGNDDRLNQYTITDLHLGMLAWGEETRVADWDLSIAEKLILAWFAAAIAQSPDAATAVLAQLGDLLHHDAKVSVTPAHHHVLDADSRLQKMIRVAIRIIRQIVRMLLEKHQHVHLIMADANHDEAGGSWLRELFAAYYEDEPRVTVETSPNTYCAVEHGLTSLFYHHGHKKKIKQVDSVFAGLFRELFGRTKFSYGHTGHLHSDELVSTNLMKVERHETLAPPDAYGANWLSGRSAKVITYSKRFGEVGRITLTPEMVSSVGC